MPNDNGFTIENGVLKKYKGKGGKVTIPNDVKTIGVRAFFGDSKVTEIEIPNSVTEIGERAFDVCSSLKNIKIPKSVTKIGAGAFASVEA